MEDFEDDPRGAGSSIAAPLIRALLAAAVAFGIYWLVFGQADPADDVTVAEPTETSAVATVPPDPLATAPTIAPTAAATPTPTPVATATTTTGEVGSGVTVQVLNGTDDAELFSSAVQALRDLGYDVTESGRARQDYTETTIFATEGQEEAAAALQAADPRFGVIGENPGNLTTEIDVHVVVGSDWEPQPGDSTDSDAAATPEPGATESATEEG